MVGFSHPSFRIRRAVLNVAQPLVQASLLGEAIDPGPVAVMVADDQMGYVAVNRYSCELLGYTREELLSLKVTDVARYPEAQAEFQEMIAAGQASGIATLVRKDGSDVRVRYNATETSVAKLTFYVSVAWIDGDGP